MSRLGASMQSVPRFDTTCMRKTSRSDATAQAPTLPYSRTVMMRRGPKISISHPTGRGRTIGKEDESEIVEKLSGIA